MPHTNTRAGGHGRSLHAKATHDRNVRKRALDRDHRLKTLQGRFIAVADGAHSVDAAGLRKVLDASVTKLFLPRAKRLSIARTFNEACSDEALKYVMHVANARKVAAPVVVAAAESVREPSPPPLASAPPFPSSAPAAPVVCALRLGEVVADPAARISFDQLDAVEKCYTYWHAREDETDEVFRAHDVDSSGDWGRDELRAALVALEVKRRPEKQKKDVIHLSDATFEAIVAEADFDGDAVFDRAEVLWALTLWGQMLTEEWRNRKSASCGIA